MCLIIIQERLPTIVRDLAEGSLPHVDNARKENPEDRNGVDLPRYGEGVSRSIV
jgi:hypothetical protein